MAEFPAYRIPNMIRGMIMLWAGDIATIPSGWHLCNGLMGTPDLTGKFPVAAGDTYDVDVVGGVIEHSHSGSFASHWHALWPVKICLAGAKWYGCPNLGTGDKSGSIATDSQDNLPPYHSLCFMMKL